jgi:hypothetical protein
VDTPGTNAVVLEHERLTQRIVPRADIVIFLTRLVLLNLLPCVLALYLRKQCKFGYRTASIVTVVTGVLRDMYTVRMLRTDCNAVIAMIHAHTHWLVAALCAFTNTTALIGHLVKVSVFFLKRSALGEKRFNTLVYKSYKYYCYNCQCSYCYCQY